MLSGSIGLWLFHGATLRDSSESRLFEDRPRHNLTEFLFWRSS